MEQIKRKTNRAILSFAMSFLLVFALAAAFLPMPANETAYAAGTRTIETITIADMYANKDTGTYGNYSWDPSKLKEITNSSFTIKASVAVGYQPFYICWTKPSGTASPTKLRYGYTPGADVTKQSASKGLENTLPTDNRASGGNYAVEEITLYGNNDTMYFYFSSGYMYEDIVVTSVIFQPKVNTVAVSVAAGTGVSSVYLSKDQNATSGSNSGTNFDKGDTVYAFATLAEGYKRPNNNWTLVSGTADTAGAIYRVSSYTMGTSDYNFGTINAAAKTKSLTRNKNGAGYLSNLTLTYGQTADLTVPTRNGYNFLGWNTKADGTGATYGNESSATLTASQVNAIIDDNSINTVYAMWKITPETVIGFIEAIPNPVVYTQDCKNAIDTARSGYSDLGNDEKALVTNYDVLTAAESAYDGMQADKEALDAYKTEKKADANSLAQSGDSAACGTLITNAKDAIDAVVYDYTKTLAENKAVVDAILYALESDLYNQRQADEVAEYIDAISDPVTLASKPDINTARALYNGLSDNQKSLVGNYNKLTEAEAAYADVLANCEAKIGDNYYTTLADAYTAAAENATITINKDYDVSGRGDPYINVTKDVAIDLAGHTLTIGQGSSVTVTEGAVLSIKNSVPATGGIKGRAGVDPSSGSYVLLFDSRLNLAAATVKQYAVINHIAEGYLVEDINNGAADENGYYSIVRPITAADVIAAIDAIGEVEYTQECKGKIDEARALYDGLIAGGKDSVTNYETLTNAESTYTGMKSDKEALDAYKTEKKADADALAEEGDSAACGTLITNAKADIDAVVYDCTKTLAENKAVVDAILSALENNLNDKRAAEAVDALINAIDLPVTTEEENDIIAARGAFNALTDEQKELVENKDKLFTAAVDLVKEYIDAIPKTVTYTKDCKDAIGKARNFFDKLTEAEQALVENKQDLLDAEAAYIPLENQAKADEIKELIGAIGTVTYPDSKETIEKARAGYDGLSEAQKPLVDNYGVLTAAESTYAELEEKANKKLSGGAIVGIVIGCVAFVAIVAFLLWFFLFKKKKEDKDEPANIPEAKDEPQDDQAEEPKE